MRNDKENVIVTKTLQFSLQIITFCELLEEKRKYVISNQLLKSATSIGANVREAQNAESKADFIHKMKVAAKEADETEYWLVLCQHAPNYPNCEMLLDEVNQIMKILAKIIGTSKG
ncbi:four helix bundle protein [Runella defluvii]|uniref:Four helix bundle protein n=1 Tax=Runella defluvii TaxID=370973 RepID=A0A7W5ZGC5_9BACT|nr:four helix bundle protein [Runella defluvii]MBB3836334.1 four helix bundle protein [Runella defluvii]